MSFEANLSHLGVLVAGIDGRDSTFTGTTHLGPNGSLQFMAVRMSTVTDLTVLGCTVAGQAILGVLQNKPSTLEAADVGFMGVTKAVAGTTFGPGVDLMVDSSGAFTPYTTAAGQFRVGKSLETVSSVGQIFAMYLYGGSNPQTAG